MYQCVEVASDGRHIVENTETGERYRRTPDKQWKQALDTWREDVGRFRPLLERLCRRAATRGTWNLYYVAKRAMNRKRLPCPMPWGHVMFNTCRRRRAAKVG